MGRVVPIVHTHPGPARLGHVALDGTRIEPESRFGIAKP